MSASMIVIYITRETGLLRERGCNLKTVMRDCFSFIMAVGYEKAEKFPDWSDSFGRSEIASSSDCWMQSELDAPDCWTCTGHFLYRRARVVTAPCTITLTCVLSACVSGLYTSAGMPGQRAHSQSGRTRQTPV